MSDPLSCLLSQNKITVHLHGAEDYVLFVPAALTTRKVEEAVAVDEELKSPLCASCRGTVCDRAASPKRYPYHTTMQAKAPGDILST